MEVGTLKMGFGGGLGTLKLEFERAETPKCRWGPLNQRLVGCGTPNLGFGAVRDPKMEAGNPKTGVWGG